MYGNVIVNHIIFFRSNMYLLEKIFHILKKIGLVLRLKFFGCFPKIHVCDLITDVVSLLASLLYRAQQGHTFVVSIPC